MACAVGILDGHNGIGGLQAGQVVAGRISAAGFVLLDVLQVADTAGLFLDGVFEGLRLDRFGDEPCVLAQLEGPCSGVRLLDPQSARPRPA